MCGDVHLAAHGLHLAALHDRQTATRCGKPQAAVGRDSAFNHIGTATDAVQGDGCGARCLVGDRLLGTYVVAGPVDGGIGGTLLDQHVASRAADGCSAMDYRPARGQCAWLRCHGVQRQGAHHGRDQGLGTATAFSVQRYLFPHRLVLAGFFVEFNVVNVVHITLSLWTVKRKESCKVWAPRPMSYLEHAGETEPGARSAFIRQGLGVDTGVIAQLVRHKALELHLRTHLVLQGHAQIGHSAFVGGRG